ncbi:MAG: hypothetical protein BA863_17820 [Desulfovibrio sp. S3730MH75]|nr:MAG: hypothetical protein BA863_17820 [Desulfovibrio sp. S3730MH75]
MNPAIRNISQLLCVLAAFAVTVMPALSNGDPFEQFFDGGSGMQKRKFRSTSTGSGVIINGSKGLVLMKIQRGRNYYHVKLNS